jgi:hypothetical protein
MCVIPIGVSLSHELRGLDAEKMPLLNLPWEID